VPTKTVFGDQDFPQEFSILATLKIKKPKGARNSMYLFSLLHKSGYTQLGLEVDEDPRFVYKDNQNNEKTGLPKVKRVKTA